MLQQEGVASLHNSPGYSACGGPWITPEESMKQPVWRVESASSEGVLTGGSGVPPLQENGVVHICNKRRDAASPSHVRFSCFDKRREAV
ncbi:MAG: hypothetical protein E7049_07880 [Lentisphaerae bacterium]|nr:hypothetical protein [Lentisphaerota bacterium]